MTAGRHIEDGDGDRVARDNVENAGNQKPGIQDHRLAWCERDPEVRMSGGESLDQGAQPIPIIIRARDERIEDDVVAVPDQPIHISIAEGGRPGMDLAGKVQTAVVGLVRGRRAAAVQVRGDPREGRAHCEGLQRKQDAAAGPFLDPAEYGEVFLDASFTTNAGVRTAVTYRLRSPITV
ncbi:MAG: hypothetical protein WBM40_17715 [Thiohalocapsa sp.]